MRAGVEYPSTTLRVVPLPILRMERKSLEPLPQHRMDGPGIIAA
jgi:hypothetical protein